MKSFAFFTRAVTRVTTRDCGAARDALFEGETPGEERPLADQARLALHLLFCPRCAELARRLAIIREMRAGFFPPSPCLGDDIMEEIAALDGEAETVEAGGFSFRSWVITGCFIFLSLSTVFFGLDFNHIAKIQGSSYLVPMGITVGVVLTVYGALFIGSHLEELSSRFNLR